MTPTSQDSLPQQRKTVQLPACIPVSQSILSNITPKQGLFHLFKNHTHTQQPRDRQDADMRARPMTSDGTLLLCCCVTCFHSIYRPRTAHTCYFTPSGGQQAPLTWVLGSELLLAEVQDGLPSSQSSLRKGSQPKLQYLGQELTLGRWPKDLSSLLAADTNWAPPIGHWFHFPAHTAEKVTGAGQKSDTEKYELSRRIIGAPILRRAELPSLVKPFLT